MNEDDIRRAARAAYEAHCAIHGIAAEDRHFKVAIAEWIAVARAVVAADDPEWPLRARVWTRTSTEPHHKVLEIEGVLDGVHVNSRHTQSLSVGDSDVPGLPELYADGTIPADVSNYARAIATRMGVEGLKREAERLLHKIATAASLYRDGAVKALLNAGDPAKERISRMEARGDVGGICREIDMLQGRIAAAQRMADPFGKASLVLHTSEEHWDRWPSYQAKIDALRPTADA